jgi:hypothetical protein
MLRASRPGRGLVACPTSRSALAAPGLRSQDGVGVKAVDEDLDSDHAEQQAAESGQLDALGPSAQPSGRGAGVQETGVHHSGDERPDLHRISAPVPAHAWSLHIAPAMVPNVQTGNANATSWSSAPGPGSLCIIPAGRHAPGACRSANRYTAPMTAATRKIPVAAVIAVTWMASQYDCSEAAARTLSRPQTSGGPVRPGRTERQIPPPRPDGHLASRGPQHVPPGAPP